ncbi:MAG: class I SAM-dependent methyltransferase [Parcubacteria group bacterium]
MNQYDKIGKKYLEGQKIHFRKIHDGSTDFIVNAIKQTDFKNKKILDIGCGDGKHMRLLEKLGAKHVYGLEPSKVMLNEAIKLGSDPKHLIHTTLERNKLSPNSFEILYARFSIHHDKTIASKYRAASKLLKPGGILIITVPHPIRIASLIKSGVYKSGEKLTTYLFKSRLPIHSHMHTFEEYLSKDFLKDFDLKEFVEEKNPSIKIGKLKVPEFIGLVAIRRKAK